MAQAKKLMTILYRARDPTKYQPHETMRLFFAEEGIKTRDDQQVRGQGQGYPEARIRVRFRVRARARARVTASRHDKGQRMINRQESI